MKRIIIILFLLVLLILTCCNLTLPINSYFINIAKNLFHFPLFIMITTGVYYLLPKNKFRLIFCAGISVLIAGSTEFIQIFNQRDADWHDVFLNMIGISCVLLFLSYKTNRSKLTSMQWKLIWELVIIFIFWGMSPLLYQAYAHIRTDISFPQIDNFESPIGMYQFIPNRNSSIKRVAEHASQGKYSLQIILHPGPYPGVHIMYFPSDWSKLQTFSFDLFNSQTDTVKMHLRFDDNDAESYNDWGHAEIIIFPGLNNIEIPVTQIISSPPSDPLNSHKIRKVVLFMIRPDKSMQFYLDNIHLN
ncbi:VanZ family protein [candidate division KSB1 bacterium]|nr:VanZ family protein [candidate division KSB1 bacterium]